MGTFLQNILGVITRIGLYLSGEMPLGKKYCRELRLNQRAVSTGLFAGASEGVLQCVRVHGIRVPTIGKKPWPCAVCTPRLAQITIQCIGQGRKPFLGPRANNPKRFIRCVHAVHCQRHGFANAQTAVIHALKHDGIQRHTHRPHPCGLPLRGRATLREGIVRAGSQGLHVKRNSDADSSLNLAIRGLRMG